MVEHKDQTAAMISWRREFLTAMRYTPWRYAAARLLREGGPSIDSWPVWAAVCKSEDVWPPLWCCEITRGDIALDTQRLVRAFDAPFRLVDGHFGTLDIGDRSGAFGLISGGRLR